MTSPTDHNGGPLAHGHGESWTLLKISCTPLLTLYTHSTSLLQLAVQNALHSYVSYMVALGARESSVPGCNCHMTTMVTKTKT